MYEFALRLILFDYSAVIGRALQSSRNKSPGRSEEEDDDDFKGEKGDKRGIKPWIRSFDVIHSFIHSSIHSFVRSFLFFPKSGQCWLALCSLARIMHFLSFPDRRLGPAEYCLDPMRLIPVGEREGVRD